MSSTKQPVAERRHRYVRNEPYGRFCMLQLAIFSEGGLFWWELYNWDRVAGKRGTLDYGSPQSDERTVEAEGLKAFSRLLAGA